MSEMKVPEGYKQTEIGVIPEDWKVTTIGDFAPLQRGFDLPTTKVEAGDYPVVYSNGIVRNHKDFQVKGAGIVTGRSGTIGKVHYIESDFWPHNTTLWVTSFGDAHVKFVYYLFKYIGFERFKSGSGVPTLNRNDAHSFKTTVPTKVDEQTAIATALSDVDNLIQSLEKLIAKKEAIKTGAMQQLLTGKTRLPEFATREDGSAKGFKHTELGRIPEDWSLSPMREVIYYCSAGATPYRGNESFYKGTNRWITSGELNYCVINDTIEKISDNAIEKTNLKIHPAGTFLMAITGLEAAGTRGSCGIIGQPSTTNQSCMAIYPNKNLTSKYLYHWYVYNGNELALKYCQGTKQMSYTAGLIQRLPIYLPTTTKEQTAIATILSDMDAEIQALQQRLDKTHDIKQGMMQQLLTGKVRLAH